MTLNRRPEPKSFPAAATNLAEDFLLGCRLNESSLIDDCHGGSWRLFTICAVPPPAIRAGANIAEGVIMETGGLRNRSVFEGYVIVTQTDISNGLQKPEARQANLPDCSR
jgi:hypothetical protein